MTQLTRKQQQLFNALSIVVGNAMYALTVVLFLMPSGLITGGATGIALAFNKVTGLPVSAILFVVNVAMLLLGWWVLGPPLCPEYYGKHRAQPLFYGPVGAAAGQSCTDR